MDLYGQRQGLFSGFCYLSCVPLCYTRREISSIAEWLLHYQEILYHLFSIMVIFSTTDRNPINVTGSKLKI